MTLAEALFVLVAGLGAGTVNSVVGSGGLITFPVLLATGMPPVTANITNTVGVLPGAIFGAIGYRRELAGQRTRVLQLSSASLVGGTVGSVLLLALPGSAFETVVPILIFGAVVLVLIQPSVARFMASRPQDIRHSNGGAALWLAVLLTGVYGGYFGAAQGVILLGAMGLLLAESLQRINATKNMLAFFANGVAALLFLVFAFEHIRWTAVVLLAVGSAVGGTLGSRFGRRLPERSLRWLIVAVGLVAAVQTLR